MLTIKDPCLETHLIPASVAGFVAFDSESLLEKELPFVTDNAGEAISRPDFCGARDYKIG